MRPVRIALALALVAALTLAAAPEARAQTCGSPASPSEFWTATYVDTVTRDKAYDTTYSITAPCKVFIGVEFLTTVRVVDNLWEGYDRGTLAKLWSITDYPEGATTVTVASGTIFPNGAPPFLNPAGGTWVATLATTYTGTPVNHVIGFKFTPGGNAMNFAVARIANGFTVDPFPPCPAGQQADGAGGCADCPAGTANPVSGGTCEACPAGTFAAEPGATACTACPAGTAAGDAGAIACGACAPGTFAPEPASTTCVPRAFLTPARRRAWTCDDDCNVGCTSAGGGLAALALLGALALRRTRRR